MPDSAFDDDDHYHKLFCIKKMMMIKIIFIHRIIVLIQVGTLFHGLASILTCHMRLRAALNNAIAKWDKVNSII